MLVIINYGLGNIGSILNMFRKIGVVCKASNQVEDIQQATQLLLPGVGSFDRGMLNIRALGLEEVLHQRVQVDKIPFLGVCLGMQLLAYSSAEGKEKGLGYIDAEVKRFNFSNDESKLKIPHMGWNTVVPAKPSTLFNHMPEEMRFYFVHSYYFACHHPADILGVTSYGNDFVSMVQKENVYGVQFHPEKSHKFGMQLLKNFAEVS